MAGPLDGVLGILGGAPQQPRQVPASDPVWQIPAGVQRQRDADRLALLKGEAQNASAPADRAALAREIARTKQGIGQQPLDGALSILNGGSAQSSAPRQPVANAAAAIPVSADERAYGARQPAAPPAQQEPSLMDKLKGAGEAGLHMLSTIPASVPASIAAASQIIGGGQYGTQAGVAAAKQRFDQTLDDYSYSPRTQAGQQYTQAIGQKMSDLGLEGVPIPELNNMAAAAKSAAPAARAMAGRAVANFADQYAQEQAASGAMRGAPVAKPRIKLNVDGSTTPVQPQGAAGGAGGAIPPSGTRPTAQPSGTPGPLPAAEQARRAQLLSDIGINDARKSVVTGDPKAAATDYQTSRLDSPAGRLLDAKFNEERAALENHADSIVRGTGGTIGTDQSALYGRGSAMIAPLDQLKSWFDNRASDLYKVADERAQGVPTTLDSFRTMLGDDSEMTNSDRVHLRGAVNAYAKKLGMMDDAGNVFANGQQAETMRKFLGENWSPANGRFVSKLKDALDNDVFSSAGEDVYGQARQMWALRKQTLDNPNGIAKIMDASGPEGINRAVPLEKIPDAIAGMPSDQFQHVVNTLQRVPDELQPMAQQALSEIKAHFANKVLDAGRSTKTMWNQKAVKAYLANNNDRMVQVFTPEEMQKFQTLRDAGDILNTDRSYPGAAAQSHNLLRSGTMAAIKTGATSVGAALGGAGGAALGSVVGDKAAGAFGDTAGLRAAQKRLVPLSSLLPK